MGGDGADQLRKIIQSGGMSAGLSPELTDRRLPYFNWERVWYDSDFLLLSSKIDRFWIDYTAGEWELQAGRQRIAWGTNLVWNPVDIFNPSSPFDFDNEEKPGADGARVIWYTSAVTKLEAAVTIPRDYHHPTGAIQWKGNISGYDLFVMAGKKGTDLTVGGAFAGSIKGAGFRGELLCAIPDSLGSATPAWTASVGGDYTFQNSIYLHSQLLYQSYGTIGNAGGLNSLTAYTEGWFSPARWSWFGQVSGELHPLVRGDLSTIVNPMDGSFYLAPTLSWSALTNLDIVLSGMIYEGGAETEFGSNSDMVLLRGKYTFEISD